MINMTARGFVFTSAQKENIEKELKRVEKMLPTTASFEVTITSCVEGYQCDITVKDAGSFIRGEAVSPKVEVSADLAVDDLKRKLRKLKTKLSHKNRQSGIDTIATAMGDWDLTGAEEDDQQLSSEVKRRKNVELKMMTEDEAIVQMEMLGHSFFVYLGEDGQPCVVYHRKHGYGILACEK